MTALLSDRFGIGPHELVAVVGAGGKSTILFALGEKLATRGSRVLLTTTTRMATDQVTDPACWSDDPADVDAALVPGTALFVAIGRTREKVAGLGPEAVDRLYSATSADHVLVEADGARSKSIKSPADHEPVIPDSATMVIVVVGIDAIGEPLHTVAHRPDRITALTGLGRNDIVTAPGVAAVLLHPDGGLKSIPDAARVVMAITKVSLQNSPVATSLAQLLEAHPRVERTIRMPDIRYQMPDARYQIPDT